MSAVRVPARIGRALLMIPLLVSSGDGVAAQDKARLGHQVVPTYQKVSLQLDADRDDFTGTVDIAIEVKEPTRAFTLHSMGPSLVKLVLTAGGKEVPVQYKHLEYGLLEVASDAPLPVGPGRLVIEFMNRYDTTAVSLYKTEVEGQGYLFSQMEADEARKAFPCWDEPAFKIPYQLTLTVPEGHTAVTNTSIVNERVADGWRTYEFAKSKPMPAYLIAIATGTLETVDIPGMSIPGRVITVKGRTHLAGEAIKSTPPILAKLEEYFGMPYPYEKLDLIAVPEFWPGAMENIGAVTYAEGILLLDPATVSLGQRRTQAIVTAHELAHMWFGDMVTMEWWDDLWLNESFASWMETKICHELHPEYDLDVSQVRAGQGAMNTDARPSTRAIRKPVLATDNIMQSADGLTYSKGEAVLSMFEQWLGPEVFRQGIVDYLNANAWGNATAYDLWTSLAKVSGRDIDAAMSTFLDQGGVPLVSATPALDHAVTLTQRRFANYGVEPPDEPLWHIPVTLSYYDGTGVKSVSVLLDQPEMTVPLELEGTLQWVLPNADMDGYYRWEVPPPMLATLAEHSTEWLNTRERVGLLNNLAAQLDAGTISGDQYLRTLNHFADAEEPQVVSALLSGLGKVRNAFVTPEYEDEFAAYVRGTLGPALKRFGLAEQPEEDESVTRFRPQLIGWLGDEGEDPKVIAYADSLTRAFMDDPASVSPEIAGVALGLTARHGDQVMFEEFRTRFEQAQAPRERSRYLGLLGNFRDSALVQEALRYCLEGPLRPTEIFTIPFDIGSDDEYEQLIFDWMIEHYDDVTGRIPPHFRSFMPFIAGGCSRERLAVAKEFFADPAHNVPGTDDQMAKVTDQVTDCAGLREREGQAVAAYLTHLATMD